MPLPDLLAAFTQRITRPYPWSRPAYLFPLNATPVDTTAKLAPGQVPARRTTLTKTQARAVLKTALTSVLGRAPTANELAMLVAQSDLETRTWQAMWNWNFGNSVVGASTANWFKIPVSGQEKYQYRDFKSAKDGALYYVKMLQRHFTKAWAQLDSGDTYAFAQALKDQSYYEAPVEDYASGLASRYAVA